jgi:hypothetical protein
MRHAKQHGGSPTRKKKWAASRHSLQFPTQCHEQPQLVLLVSLSACRNWLRHRLNKNLVNWALSCWKLHFFPAFCEIEPALLQRFRLNVRER